ncbi:alpha/beta fold hydrolase [Alloactinosynnema sp. L-07]|uniref:alpha/beta fold hydrolase n=1 Tax=Alloactinosynnema sp. L-07 TaxID=1653480 RepID=UPI0009EEE313|nr:alpha/beta fold hydrolase [Alloactinosynnema sp. L-07]
MGDLAAVFVHGLFSDSTTWESIASQISQDEDLSNVDVKLFQYDSPVFRRWPTRRIPSMDTLGLRLRTWLANSTSEYKKIVLVSHSMGGLVVQNYLAVEVTEGRARNLQKIASVALITCPNEGSEFLILLRRFAPFWNQPQERSLRPMQKEIDETRRIVLQRIAYARDLTDSTCPIPIWVYTAESDGVVTRRSALSMFNSGNYGALPGGHSDVIQVAGQDDETYLAIKARLLDAVASVTSADLGMYARMTPDDICHALRALREHWQVQPEIKVFLESAYTDLRHAIDQLDLRSKLSKEDYEWLLLGALHDGYLPRSLVPEPNNHAALTASEFWLRRTSPRFPRYRAALLLERSSLAERSTVARRAISESRALNGEILTGSIETKTVIGLINNASRQSELMPDLNLTLERDDRERRKLIDFWHTLND